MLGDSLAASRFFFGSSVFVALQGCGTPAQAFFSERRLLSSMHALQCETEIFCHIFDMYSIDTHQSFMQSCRFPIRSLVVKLLQSNEKYHSIFAAFESVPCQDSCNTTVGGSPLFPESCTISSVFRFRSLAIGSITKDLLTFSSMTTTDLLVQISQIPVESLPTVATHASEFFNAKLDGCLSKKCHTLKSVVPSTLEFLVRIEKVSIAGIKKAFNNCLNKAGHADKITSKIKELSDGDRMKHLLDTSCQAKIDWPALSVISADHVSGTQAAEHPSASNQSLTMHAGQASSPSVLSGSEEKSGPQDPGRIFTFADAIRDSQGRLSGSNLRKAPEERTSSDLFVVKGKQVSQGGRLNSASRIVFVLSNATASEKLEAFKSDIIEIFQARTYEAGVDATRSSETQRLHVKIACTWKNAMHSHSIRRLIHGTIAGRFKVDGNVKVFDLKATGTSWFHNQSQASSRWLQYSGLKGKAYTMPMQKLLDAIGNVVEDEEAQLLSCTTHADFRANAKSKQLLLANLLDVFRWRFLFSPAAVVTEPAQAPTVTESHPPVAASSSYSSDCAAPRSPCPELLDSEVAERTPTRRNLHCTFGTNPSGGAGPACNSQPGHCAASSSFSSWLWCSTDSFEVFLQAMWLNEREEWVGEAERNQLNRDPRLHPTLLGLRKRKSSSL